MSKSDQFHYEENKRFNEEFKSDSLSKKNRPDDNSALQIHSAEYQYLVKNILSGLKNEIAEIKILDTEKDFIINQLNTQSSSQKETINSLLNQIRQKQQQIQELLKDNIGNKKTISENEKCITNLNLSIEQKDHLLSTQLNQLERKNERIKNLEKNLLLSIDESKRLEDLLHSKLDIIQRLNIQLTAFKRSWPYKIISILNLISVIVSPKQLISKIKATKKIQDSIRQISDSQLFDITYYEKNNPDVAKSGMNGAKHYILYGGFEGRNPSEKFDSAFYLESHRDVEAANVNPLYHYLSSGIHECRIISAVKNEILTVEKPIFPPVEVEIIVPPIVKIPAPTNDIDELSLFKKILGETGLFDPDYYYSQKPEIKNMGVDAFEDFINYGWKEKLNPCHQFITSFYLSANNDIREAGINPFMHYLLFGWKEGRKPFESFILPEYLTNEDIDVNSFIYWLKNNYKNTNNDVISYSNQLNTFTSSTNDEAIPERKREKIVVVFHIFHTDVVDECLTYLKNIPFGFDLLITTSLPEDHVIIEKVKKIVGNTTVFKCDNEGRDIGAFLKVWTIICQYELCCKIHTKKGDSAYIELWRKLCLDGVLGSADLIHKIIRQFEADPDIALAGNELLYGSFKSLIGKNGRIVDQLISELSIPINHSENNGFFMGTMFWMRPSKFPFIYKLGVLEYPTVAGRNDGGVEHAIERMLGSLTLKPVSRIVLTRSNSEKIASCKIVDYNYESKITTFHNYFDSIVYSINEVDKIIGFIDDIEEHSNIINGWLAIIGDETPREAIILIDEVMEVDICCDKHRIDLEDGGINLGNHSFVLAIPSELSNGQQHKIKLIDKQSGKVVHGSMLQKNRVFGIDINRSSQTWNKRREEKFYNILNSVRHSGHNSNNLVSIIMPTYNRAAIIEKAIESALAQTYRNFELIIIDDASIDNTSEILIKYSKEERIKYIKSEKVGVSGARNIGLNHSTGQYIFFLDSDNEWYPHYLQNMVDYMIFFDLDSTYCGMMLVDENHQFKYFRGSDFSWDELRHANYIDMNSFGHKRLPENSKIQFNIELKRLVDWEYILLLTKNNSVSYAPFLGVRYNDGNAQRITNTEYTREGELSKILADIRERYSGVKRNIDDSEFYFEYLWDNYRYHSINCATVDTIITSFNHENFIAKALDSALVQKGNIQHRIIVSDDGSTDNSCGIINVYAENNRGKIIDISSKENKGLTENFKRCLEKSDAEFIAILEGDDYWTDNYKLQKQILFLRDNPDCSMVFSKIEVHDLAKGKRRFLNRQEGLTKNKLDGEDFLAHPSLNLIANFSCCLFRSSILKTLPEIVYKNRINEIVVAFYFEQFGKIGYIDEVMSVYQQHQQGLWTGSDHINQLISGFKTRQIVLEIAHPNYKDRIQQIIDEKFILPLEKLGYF